MATGAGVGITSIFRDQRGLTSSATASLGRPQPGASPAAPPRQPAPSPATCPAQRKSPRQSSQRIPPPFALQYLQDPDNAKLFALVRGFQFYENDKVRALCCRKQRDGRPSPLLPLKPSGKACTADTCRCFPDYAAIAANLFLTIEHVEGGERTVKVDDKYVSNWYSKRRYERKQAAEAAFAKEAAEAAAAEAAAARPTRAGGLRVPFGVIDTNSPKRPRQEQGGTAPKSARSTEQEDEPLPEPMTD